VDMSTESIHSRSEGSPVKKPAPWWRKPFGIILIVFLSIFLFFFVSGMSLIVKFIQGADGNASGEGSITEELISGSGKTKVVRISVSGVIVERSRAAAFYDKVATADRVIEELQTAGEDKNVAAVMLRVDSPGGGVTASDRIHREVEKLREKKVVVVLMGDTAASGGYYISAAANRIFAHPTTVTGSIGVIVNSVNFHDLMKQFGVQAVTIKSGEYKDLLSPFKPVDELANDKAVYQRIVTTLYDRFAMLVSKGRNIPIDRVKELADGRIYDAQTALENKLIDEIGYQDDVLAWLKKKLGQKDLMLVEYTRPGGFFSRIFLESSDTDIKRVAISESLRWLELGARPMYLWLPGL
jgi:protease IV